MAASINDSNVWILRNLGITISVAPQDCVLSTPLGSGILSSMSHKIERLSCACKIESTKYAAWISFSSEPENTVLFGCSIVDIDPISIAQFMKRLLQEMLRPLASCAIASAARFLPHTCHACTLCHCPTFPAHLGTSNIIVITRQKNRPADIH